MKRATLIVAVLTALGAVAAPLAVAAPGDLTFVESEIDGVGGANGLDAAGNVVGSPDGRNVYVATAFSDQTITAFARDPLTNALTPIDAEVDGVGGVDLGDMFSAFEISPDGRSLFAGVSSDDALVSFTRDPATGQLTFSERFVDDTPGVDGLRDPGDIAVSPDGHSVYVAGAVDDMIALFARDPATGKLTFVEVIEDGIGGVQIPSVRHLAMSPDGRNLYAAGQTLVATLIRDLDDGRLTFAGTQQQGQQGVTGLGSVQALAISAEGSRVYASSDDGSGGTTPALVVFDRDPDLGILTFIVARFRGDPGIAGLHNPLAIAPAPAGQDLYLAANTGSPTFLGTVTRFNDDDPANRLAYVQNYPDGGTGGAALTGIRDIAVTCDGTGVYVAAANDAAVSAFSREGGSGTCAPNLAVKPLIPKQTINKKKPGLQVLASCGKEICEVAASGKIKKAGKLKTETAAPEFDAFERMSVKIPRKTARRARERLLDDKKTVAKVNFTGTDLAGNVATAKLKIPLRRRKH